MATDLGKVGIRIRGTWNSSNTYETMDLVYYNNSSYIAKQAVPANTTPTDTTYWQVALQAPFSSGRFITNAITPGVNEINISSYTPYQGTMPTNGDKTIAMVSGYWDVNDQTATVCMAGTKMYINASKNNSHIGINWIQIP